MSWQAMTMTIHNSLLCAAFLSQMIIPCLCMLDKKHGNLWVWVSGHTKTSTFKNIINQQTTQQPAAGHKPQTKINGIIKQIQKS